MRSLALFALMSTAASAQAPAQINPARMTGIVRELTSAPYQGRGPGTPGEERTIGYLAREYRALGLEPISADGSYFQSVPLVRTKLAPTTQVTIDTNAGPVALTEGQGIYVNTVRDADRVTIAKAPLVFVGYGVTAPERAWDDFKGVDLKGKIAVFLVNDPDFEAAAGEAVAGKFGGRRMTYYGRWTYKYDEAARRGAIGALIVHDTAGAGYGWETVRAPGGENYDIVRQPGDYRVALQGWLEGAAATDLFKRSGLDLTALRIAARRDDFRPVPLPGAALSVDAPVELSHVESHNVIGRIKGSGHPDETIVYGAHWDAYGIGAPDAQGKTVRQGAGDDGTGVAGVLELARLFRAGPAPDRSVVFALWTAEERGLLGSEAYAAHPLFPVSETVAVLTMDVLQTAGPAKDVVLVGNGQSELEDMLAAAAAKQGRRITPEALPERGLFYRADHFSLVRRGVPALLLMGMSGGHDLAKGGRKAGDKWLADYMKCYHQPCDDWSPKWDLRGAAQDVQLFYDIGASLANSRAWPDWREGSEFKALRAKTAAARR
ncbi:M28 family peptidase [Sphingomonas sp. BIUV-7]|uniref:M28 family peptidase n=1 Tax=Sphingomonas natans TaxID=3063330 RepID=A0ABT8YAT1_9SPHN|nr:M28 family peptidase [Sphingomonas sp. BIUV-7]MDO6414824.1 M28 family peptidase [Sphingomonas sp. BIUV-7]